MEFQQQVRQQWLQNGFNGSKRERFFYPTLGWNMLLGRCLKVRNWWDEIDENVIIGAMPFARDVEKMAALGVRGVVNTCQEYEGPVAEYERLGIQQLRVPTIDFTHPSLESVQRSMQFMTDQVEDGGKIYVHCKAGRARSATVVVCWLIHQGMTAEQAQNLLLEKRPHANPRIYQRPVVMEFERMQKEK